MEPVSPTGKRLPSQETVGPLAIHPRSMGVGQALFHFLGTKHRLKTLGRVLNALCFETFCSQRSHSSTAERSPLNSITGLDQAATCRCTRNRETHTHPRSSKPLSQTCKSPPTPGTALCLPPAVEMSRSPAPAPVKGAWENTWMS